MKLRKLYYLVIIILILLKILFNFITIISTQSKKSYSYEYLVNKVLTDDKSFDLWDGLDKSDDVIPFQSGLKY